MIAGGTRIEIKFLDGEGCLDDWLFLLIRSNKAEKNWKLKHFKFCVLDIGGGSNKTGRLVGGDD